MAVQRFKQFIGITLILVFIVGAIYKIGESSDSVVVYVFFSLIMLFIVWGVIRLLSEE